MHVWLTACCSSLTVKAPHNVVVTSNDFTNSSSGIITIMSIINPLSGRESPSLSRLAHESTPAVRSSPSYWITAAGLAFDSHTFTPEIKKMIGIVKFPPPWQGFLSRQRQQCPPCCAPKHNPQPLLKKGVYNLNHYIIITPDVLVRYTPVAIPPATIVATLADDTHYFSKKGKS